MLDMGQYYAPKVRGTPAVAAAALARVLLKIETWQILEVY